ncbi:MAG: AIDA repeat-containing protein, partial [Lentisphaeria bacterium]|nr:AIDA repeat-containing protein [Lentisphaeria bacterium]
AQTGGVVQGITILQGGRIDAISAGTVSAPVVSSGGLVYMYTGGRVVGATVRGGAVQGGGSAVDAIVSSGGRLNLLANAFASNAVISSGGSMNIASGALASVVTVLSVGRLTVESGGTALAVTSNAGAVVTVRDGGYIEYA